jgi:D-alanyl-lipoteichoic acid acyltransferase DltB (MBOAT superfamily)
MLFNSYPYFVFLIFALGTSIALERFRGQPRSAWLLLLSYIFYAWWRADFLLLLVGSTVINYLIGAAITRRAVRGASTRLLLTSGLVFNLGLIGLFKYADLFIRTADSLGAQMPLMHFFLPLAISFFTFEQISYLVDASRGQAPNYGFLEYALFVGYFPHLIAGPIIRHNELISQFSRRRSADERYDDLAVGITLFTIGLAKKTLIADNIAPFSDRIFRAAGLGPLGTQDAWLGALLFAFQIYYDFSAYSDMALGSSCMLGIRLPMNFNSPYQSASIIDFWRRWHISLSTFLRDYLYIGLGGNRLGPFRRYLNLLLTMLIGGLWHGANWTFMAWGGLHGLYLIANHGFRNLRALTRMPELPRPLGRFLGVTLTFFATTIAWVMFRATDFGAALRLLSAMMGSGGVSHIVSATPLMFAALAALFGVTFLAPNSMAITWPLLPALRTHAGRPAEPTATPFPWTWSLSPVSAFAAALTFFTAVLAMSNLSPFIYFQF